MFDAVDATVLLVYTSTIMEHAAEFKDKPLTAAFNVAVYGTFYSIGGMIVINILPLKLDFIVPVGVAGSMIYQLFKN